MTEPAARRFLPLEIRPQLALGLSSLTWGGLITLVLVAGAIVFAVVLDRSGVDLADGPPGLGFATRVALVASLTIGYTVAVWRWVAESQHRDFVELGIEDTGVDPHRDPNAFYGFSSEDLRKSRLAGLAGVFLFVLTIELPTAFQGGPPGYAWTSLHSLTYMLFLGVLFFWLAGRAAFFSIGRFRFAPALDRLPIDLLNPRPLRVFGRIALRNALLWLVGFSIATLAFVNPELRVAGSLVIFLPLTLVTVAIGVSAMFVPMRGLHARIVEVKCEELERVESAIRGDPTALESSRIADREPPPSLADLIAYKALVEAAPEWPFDGSIVRRLGLYLLIPIGSWLGGAFVERGVSTLLD